MAIVKIQSPLVGIRGKYGGMVFSANGSGPFARAFSYPVSKRTVTQVSHRANLATVRHAWNTLTPAEVADWDTLALIPPEDDYNSLGELILLSGSAWHTRINMRRIQCGDAIENTCPVATVVDPPDTFSLTVIHSTGVVTDTVFEYTSGDFAGVYAVLQCAIVQSLVRNVQTAGFMTIWSGTVDNLTYTEINDELEAAFGYMQVGQKVFGRLYRQSTDGIRSVPLEATVLVT